MSEASNSDDEKSWWLDVLEKGTRASTPHDEKLWWYVVLELDRVIGRSNVHADEAALLLAGHDPNKVRLTDDFNIDTPEVSHVDVKRLFKEFDGQHPSSLAKWLAAARKAGLVVHPVVAQIVDNPSAVAVQQTDPDLMHSPPGQSTAVDYSLLAEPKRLIEAFGRNTGMNLKWFRDVKESPGLEKARKVPGKPGRGGFPAMYCPYEVLLWLIDPKRKRGQHLHPNTYWRLLQQNFPKVYDMHAREDTRMDVQG